MKKARLILVGFGKIGRGVAESIVKKRSHLMSLGYDLKVVAVCEVKGCVVDEKGIDLKRMLSGETRWGSRKTVDVISGMEADIVVEMTPGNIRDGEPGLSHIKAALKAGKHVVTSNKSPLAVAYHELQRQACKNGLELKFEATVGGAIPVINTCRSELRANGIMNIYGILNGTTNYILSKMSEEGVEFKVALKEAQSLGLAEPDPSYDIKGIDSAVKLVILADAIMGEDIRLKDLNVVGVDSITSDAVELAKDHGFVIKLVGDVAAREVSPRLIPVEHPLNVPGNRNAILVETDLANDITLIGAGAGPKETSSAVLGDILDVADRL